MGNEFALIDWIRGRSPPSPFVPLGIGDDCAVIRTDNPAGELLVAKDVLLEGTHFDLEAASPRAVGRKALAVNLSDIAAMAGTPRSAFVGLVLPRRRGEALAKELVAGITALADEFEVCIAGGDTNVWDGPLVVSVTLVGDVSPGGAVLRSTARPGDWLCVTGALGGSLASGRHLTFTPRVREAQQIQAAYQLHAMIDLSDGLASDLRHILRESGGLSAVVEAGEVPIHDHVPPELSWEERLQHALSDGEDFELLFTVSPQEGQRLLESPPCECGLTRIGELTGGRAEENASPAPSIVLRSADGRTLPLAAGWEHRF